MSELKTFDAVQVEAIKAMLAAHMNWADIGKCFGVSPETARRAVDPVFRERRNEQVAKAKMRQPKKSDMLPIDPRLPVYFETSSGMKAVTVKMVSSTFSRSQSDSACTVPLSLPYVEFLYGAQGRAGR